MREKSDNTTDAETGDEPGPSSLAPRIATAITLLLVAGLTFYFAGDWLQLSTLANQESRLRELQANNPGLVLGIAFFVYVIATGLSLPGAAALTLVYGWYFGLRDGIILVSFASTTGATVAFLLSRFLFRESINNKFGDRLADFNQSLQREGPFYLFTLRLIPAVPFFVINAVMGLTPIRTRTFWWVSQLGMLPGTIVYTYAGSRVPSLERLAEEKIYAVFSPAQMAQILVAFALLGTFPLLVRWLLKRLRPDLHSSTDS
ncbi:MAG: TVP38/TMEM64 family protein [Planctomycetota bacterium]